MSGTRRITLAVDFVGHFGGDLIWGVVDGKSHSAARKAAQEWLLPDGDDTAERKAASLGTVTIDWPVGAALPDGDNAAALALARAALGR